jgi:hypothetical protein
VLFVVIARDELGRHVSTSARVDAERVDAGSELGAAIFCYFQRSSVGRSLEFEDGVPEKLEVVTGVGWRLGGTDGPDAAVSESVEQ